MRTGRRGALLAAVALALWPAVPARAGPVVAATRSAQPAPLFRLQDPRIGEASGIAAGIASPGVLYVHNDSGDTARFFALDARTGRTLASYTVPGAGAVDWEDIAVAPDARGVPSVWLADIGDNRGVRDGVQIYRVDEPHVPPSARDLAATAARAEVWRLRYPDGAVDAESLAVSPAGTPYLVTKSVIGTSAVYAAPRGSASGATQALRRVGRIRFPLTSTPGPFAPAGPLMATGADLSRDGSLLVVRTYTDAYLWRVVGADVAAALRRRPVRVALPEQPQGEGICFAGRRLVIDSEQAGSAVYSLPIPAVSAPAVPTPATAAPAPRSSGSTTSAAPTPAAAPEPSAARRWLGGGWLAGTAAVLAIAAAGSWRWYARRRPPRRGSSRRR